MEVDIMKKIILKSSSPRRKELLTNMGYEFEIKVYPVDEVWLEDNNGLLNRIYTYNPKNPAYAYYGGKEVEIWLLRFAVSLDRKIRYEVKDDVDFLKVEFSVLFHYGCYYIKVIFKWKGSSRQGKLMFG